MRPLFHFPFPAQPPSQQPSHCSQKCAIARILHPCAASAAPQRCFLPPARAPVPRLPDPGPLSPAPRAPAMPRPHPCLAPPPVPIAPHHLSTTPLLPAPIGLASPASRPTRATIRIPLCRHRADSALIAPLSRPSCAAVLHVLRFAVRIAPTACRHPRHPPISLLALRRPRGPGWQESHRMHPFFAECAKKAPFLAASARNACFSRSRWQHPRPMHPFPGAIGRFRIHGARILPPRALFRVREPEITHRAKMLPAPRGLSAAAACGPAERALRHAAAACDTRHGRTGFAPCGAGLACLPHARPPAISLVPAARVHRRRLICVALRRPHRAHRAPPSAASPIAVGMSCRSGSSCRPRAAHADASRHLRAAPIPPAARTHCVQETSGTTQTTQCGHKNRIPKWGPY